MTHIMSSMGQNKKDCLKEKKKIEEDLVMNEKIYKLMSSTGIASLIVGIVTLATGITAGILMIINGARLLKGKSDILI